MKKIGLLLSFVAIFSTASFAKTVDGNFFKVKFENLVKKQDAAKKTEKLVKVEFVGHSSCTVSVTYGTKTVKITVECTCTQQEACDIAYSLLRGGIK